MESSILDYLRILWRRRYLIASFILVAGVASYAASKLTPKVYEARAKILVVDQKSSAISLLSEFGGMPKNQVVNYVEILKSRSLARSVLARLRMPSDHESLKKLAASLTIQPIQGTDTIEIRVESTSPLEAQRIANTYVGCFIERNLAENQEDARQAREFIEEQLEVVSARLTRAEAALSGYQKTTKLISPSDEVRQAIGQMAGLEAERAGLDVDLAQARARLAKVQDQLTAAEQTMTSARVMARNPVFEQYRQRLSALQADLASALAQYTEKHPRVVALRAEIAQVQADLNDEIEMIVESETRSVNPIHQAEMQQALALQAEIYAAEAGRAALDEKIDAFLEKLAALPDKEMRLARLMREKESAEAIYTLLVTKKSETEITEHMRTADVRLVDPAYRPRRDEPIKPKTKLNVAVAVFLGFFTAAGLAFLLEYLDPSIKTRDEAVALLDLPVFGMIPDNEVFHKNGGKKKRFRKVKARIIGRQGRVGL